MCMKYRRKAQTENMVALAKYIIIIIIVIVINIIQTKLIS